MENEMQTQFVVIKAYLETEVSKYHTVGHYSAQWNIFPKNAFVKLNVQWLFLKKEFNVKKKSI